MVAVDTSRVETVERWSTTAFLVAAGLFAGHAAVSGLGTFTDVALPPDLFAPVGHLVALVGLLALAPVLADGSTWLGRAAVVVTAVLAAGWAVVSSAMLTSVLVGLPPTAESLVRGLAVVVLVSTVLPYVLFGTLSRRHDGYSDVVGLLLAAPGVLLFGLMVAVATIGGTGSGLVVGGGLAMAVGGLGLRLRSEIGIARARGAEADVSAG